ncbi:MAG: nickel pincer cofactor biosynthesis protein LarC [Nitrospira sp.]|nr:nickel pincer cofactor biosynthesis protein LarC [Nitrospira sp.]MCP9464852.1 nickel pincer cofactor biosynthesis protein LarC [Nitrospira sp.]
MERHLHFDCFSGISGDMVLGALVDAGLSWTALVTGLRGLKLNGYRLRRRTVRRGTVKATKVDVIVQRGFERPLSLARIRHIVTAGALPPEVKERSLAVFHRLAEAEATAHRFAAHRVQFHEVGVLDSLIDVVGCMLGCHFLNIVKTTASAVNVGSGMVQTDHGLLPVPGPAVAVLAKGIPVYSDGPRCELVTPTGIGLLRTLVSDFGPTPLMTITSIGYGAGDHNPEHWPNVLRIFLSESTTGSPLVERVMQIETNVDDLTPQAYEHVMDRLFRAGALDVVLTPTLMKRGRPGMIITCLASPERADPLLNVLFKETPTLGVRVQELSRHVLPRRIVPVTVRGKTVRMKVATMKDGTEKAAPEYRDCQAIADQTGLPLRQVMEEACLTYRANQRVERNDARLSPSQRSPRRARRTPS